MKKLFILGAVIGAAALSSLAGSPTFKSFTSLGGNANPAQINIPADPNLQIRLVDLTYSSDTNNGVITLSTGSTAFYATATNAATTSTTNQVNTTNGLSTGAVILQHAGICYTSTIASYNNTGTGVLNGGTATNVSYIVVAGGGFGVASSVGDDIYLMGQSTATRYVGSGTNAFDGAAIYVANPGRPLTIGIAPGNVTNRLTATVRYE